MTTTRHRFANNFELGAIEGCFKDIQAKYEAIEAMEVADEETADPATHPFLGAAQEIDQQYDELVNIIEASRNNARDAVMQQQFRVFPMPPTRKSDAAC
jgi:hypothetical protein